MLSREKINELASEAIEAVSVKVPDNTRWWMPEHYDQEFARLIIQEVAKASVATPDVAKASADKSTTPKAGVAYQLQLVEKWFNSKEDKDKALGLLADYGVMVGIGESE